MAQKPKKASNTPKRSSTTSTPANMAQNIPPAESMSSNAGAFVSKMADSNITGLKLGLIVFSSILVGAGVVIGGQYVLKQYQNRSAQSKESMNAQSQNSQNTQFATQTPTQTPSESKTDNSSTPTTTPNPSSTQTPNFNFNKFSKFKVNPQTLQYYLTQQYDGSFIKASLPSGWSIIEYVNGAGTNMLPTNADYSGLTGIAIKNANNKVIATLKAVDGIGGVTTCQKYYKFPDNQDVYMQQLISMSQQNGVSTQIVNVSQGQYTETKLLDVPLRRVNKLYIADVDTSDTKYESACGIGLHVLNINDLTFTCQNDNRTLHAYQLDIASDATSDDLIKLDNIFYSIEKK